MNNKILNEVDKIIEFIKESDEYKDYIYLEEKLSNNDKALALIKEIKDTQKEIVKLELKKADVSDLELKIKNNLAKLNKIPLYVEFINKQEELNEMYQIIKMRLDEYFYDKLN